MKNKINQLPNNTQSNSASNPQWYVLQTFSNYESMVKSGLERLIENYGLQNQIFEIKIPAEKTLREYSNGKKKIVERKLMPNYVFVKLVYSNQLSYLMKGVRGVLGFLETVPMKKSEVQKLHLESYSDENLSSGDTVTVLSGALRGFSGIIRSCNPATQIATVAVTMFQREQEVELEYVQLKKECA